MGRKWTLDDTGGHEFLFLHAGRHVFRYKAKKFSHCVQQELRYWTCEVFNGWFFGLHAHGGQMNIGGVDVPSCFRKGTGNMKDHRYEGYFWGGGLSAGYQWVLSNRFNIEASLVSVTCTPVMTSTSVPPAGRSWARGCGLHRSHQDAISIIYMLK